MKTPHSKATILLHEELTMASAGLRRCECGSVVVMAYEPGCTYIRCLAEKKTVMAEADWNPKRLAERWNGKNETSPSLGANEKSNE